MENYISLQKSQLLDSLENQVRFSQLVAVLVGEKGIGKTYTLEQLQKRLGDEICVAHIDASIEIQDEQLQKVICLQLGLPSDQFDSLEHIEKSIRTHLRKKALICIDNAHLLANESLNSLLKLNQSQISHQESVLFLLLAGDESLPKNISFTSTFKSHQEMCVVFQLEAIEKSEVASLVATISRLKIEEVDETYGAKQLEYFWQLSKGIPAELEYQVSRWQSEVPEVQSNLDEVVLENTSYWRAIVYLALGIVFVSILFYQDEINQLITPEQKEEISINNDVKNQLDSKRKTKKTLYKGEIKKVEGDQDNSAESNPLADKNKLNEAREAEEPQVAIDEKIKSADEVKIQKRDVIPEEKPTAEIKEIKDVVNPEKKSYKKTAKSSNNNQAVTNTVTESSATFSIDEQFLLSQPSTYLSLQWLGVSRLESAQAFRASHPLRLKMYIYKRKQTNNSYLYLVVSEAFKQRSDANAAREKYKNLNYQGTPWIKPLLAIQKEINSR